MAFVWRIKYHSSSTDPVQMELQRVSEFAGVTFGAWMDRITGLHFASQGWSLAPPTMDADNR